MNGAARGVGGPALAQAGPRRAHDGGEPERSADLDELTPRDDHFAPFAERGQSEQDGRRVVVHDQCRLADEEPGEQTLDEVGALPATPGLEVELEVAVRGRYRKRIGRRS